MKLDRQSLKKRLWKYFSIYIRTRDADWKGMVRCVTCGKMMHWKESSAGHYHPKTDGIAMYFEEKNVHNQCNRCNVHLHSNATNYALYLRKRYGEGILEELEWKSRQTVKLTEIDYVRLIDLYKGKIKKINLT
jgi:hypothetical protein